MPIATYRSPVLGSQSTSNFQSPGGFQSLQPVGQLTGIASHPAMINPTSTLGNKPNGNFPSLSQINQVPQTNFSNQNSKVEDELVRTKQLDLSNILSFINLPEPLMFVDFKSGSKVIYSLPEIYNYLGKFSGQVKINGPLSFDLISPEKELNVKFKNINETDFSRIVTSIQPMQQALPFAAAQTGDFLLSAENIGLEQNFNTIQNGLEFSSSEENSSDEESQGEPERLGSPQLEEFEAEEYDPDADENFIPQKNTYDDDDEPI
jgi:hypothetical protein